MNVRRLTMFGVLASVVVCLSGCPLFPIIDQVSVTPLGATIEAGQSVTMTASSTNAKDAPFNWTSSNPAVAVLDTNTGVSVNVTAVAPGVTTITVTGAKTGKTATATITVPITPEEPEVVVVNVTPSSAVLEAGQALTLSATSTDAADTFTWTQTNPAAVELGATTGASVGITALAAGVTTITATGSNSGAVANATISVLAAGTDGGIGTTPLVPAGLNVNITNVVIPDDRRAEVTFTATNNRGDVIPQVELTSVRFIIAHLVAPAPGGVAQYLSYINSANGQATYDGANTAGVTDNGDGTYTYKFKTALPAGFAASATHAVGAQFARLSALDGVSYPANATIEFRPDGGVVTATRDIVDTATCNDCHTRMGFHGGGRREVRLCILCHNAGTIDPESGNTVDMPVMIHKIHMGEMLPSVEEGTPYQIIGHNNSVNDYSTVVFPQDIRNCAACHREDDKAAQAGVWKTNPTQKGCGSCHDRTWFGNPNATPEGWENHPLDFDQPDDSMCKTCHPATSPGVAPIDAAHYTTYQNPAAPGLDVVITGINVNPVDGTLVINLLAKHGDGTPITDLKPIERLGTVVAWPASDYTTNKSETIQSSSGAPTGTLDTTASPTGEYVYTFKAKLPLDAGITFGIQLTGRVAVALDEGTVEEGIKSNSLMYFTTGSTEPVPRREPVQDALCAKCHGGTIRAHGEQRVGVDGCVMCHMALATDGSRRTAAQLPPVTINLKDMLHVIHTGEELEQPHSIFGFGGAELVANEIRFPGLRQQCSICHGSYDVGVPLAPEVLPTTPTFGTPPVVYGTVLPARAACTTCHDGLMVDIHAVLNSDAAQGVETCAVCHEAGALAAVNEVHKLAP